MYLSLPRSLTESVPIHVMPTLNITISSLFSTHMMLYYLSHIPLFKTLEWERKSFLIS